jgi:hypothetical protein
MTPLLADDLRRLLAGVTALPRRLSLDTPGVEATVPMLRGVWGAALHELDPAAYRAAFEGEGPPHERTPGYLLRPAVPDPADFPALEWISFGPGLAHDRSLLRAWDVASGLGLGKERRRFLVRAARGIRPDGTLPANGAPVSPWPLSEAQWFPGGDPAGQSCRLVFAAPLRLIRDGKLIAAPTLADIAVAAVRRLVPMLDSAGRERLEALRPAVLELARSVTTGPWQGGPLDLVRYSGRQKAGLEFRGVAGELELPAGPGELWPLLAAAQWLHVGKGTVVGMGQVTVRPL